MYAGSCRIRKTHGLSALTQLKGGNIPAMFPSLGLSSLTCQGKVEVFLILFYKEYTSELVQEFCKQQEIRFLIRKGR